MSKREIIYIDENKCNGCGLCVPNCAEGAIKIIDGKARLISENLCDGLGACLGHCPQGALLVEDREAAEFDESAVAEHMTKPDPTKQADQQPQPVLGGCPGSRMMSFNPEPAVEQPGSHAPQTSELHQWPVQLQLVPTSAPYFQGVDLLVAADCVPFAYPDFHRKLLHNKTVVMACPKLDDVGPYAEKLATIFRDNDIKSITVAHMEVPCCFGLMQLVKAALKLSGRTDIPVYDIIVGIQGDIK